MNITTGPLVEAYAKKFSVPVSEVLEWIDAYVHAKGLPDNMEIEPTERERATSIRAYMKRETE